MSSQMGDNNSRHQRIHPPDNLMSSQVGDNNSRHQRIHPPDNLMSSQMGDNNSRPPDNFRSPQMNYQSNGRAQPMATEDHMGAFRKGIKLAPYSESGFRPV